MSDAEGKKPRILVIEPDRWARGTLTAELVARGFEVRTASNGFSGARLALEQEPGLILMGEMLSELTHEEVVHQL